MTKAGISYLTPDALKTVIVSLMGSDKFSDGSNVDNVEAIGSIPSQDDDVGVGAVGGGTGVPEFKTGEETER